MCQLDDLRERRPSIGTIHENDSRSLRADGRFVLPGFGAADAGVGNYFVESDLDQVSAGGTYGMIVAAALIPCDEEFIRKPIASRQLLHATQVVAGKHGGRAQGEGGGATGCDETRLGVGQRRNASGSGALELLERNPLLSRLPKGVQNRIRHGCSSQTRNRSAGVDDRFDTQFPVDTHRLKRSNVSLFSAIKIVIILLD